MVDMYMGRLCKRGHDAGEGRSLRYASTRACVECHEHNMSKFRDGYNAHYYASNRDRLAAKSRDRGRTITDAEYVTLLEAQHGVCAICGASDPGRRITVFCVDHDHVTGKIRGLLCNTCNRAIGLLKDNVNVVRSAAAYLARHEDV